MICEGYTVHTERTAAEALRAMEAACPDVILLDLNLPDADGLVLVDRLRTRDASCRIPIIVLSARDRQVDRVLSLKLGADDFIRKPFELDELQARIEAVLRRARPARLETDTYAEEGEVRSSGLVMSTRRATATFHGQRLHLTPTEYRLLLALASRPDEIQSRQTLAQRIWGYQDLGTAHLIDVHAGRLRAKLRASTDVVPLETVRGRGYCWRGDTETTAEIMQPPGAGKPEPPPARGSRG